MIECPHGFTTPEVCPVCQMIKKIRQEEKNMEPVKEPEPAR